MACTHLQHAESEESEVRIVLLGKTGVGKSASGNTILGRDDFRTKLSSSSETGKCDRKTRQFDGQTVAIVDTPGLFHTNKSQDEVMKEILESITLIMPGPHVFLLVLRQGTFSRQDKETLEAFQKVFQDAKCHTIVLFTHGDQCEVEEQCKAFIKSKKYLNMFINESCEAYHVFNNKVKDETQVTGLLQTINSMLRKNQRSYYSNDMFKKAVIALEELMQCPEIKLATDPKEAATVYLEALLSKGVFLMGGQAPGLFRGATCFLEKVKQVAYECMPPEAFGVVGAHQTKKHMRPKND
ncbi:GTPase IMAP family member 9-like isoform X1 [Dicentrarchus labrax]|uniref:AIG1-type G domain-containing protein n=1 Tax=Dicentrarchus labrax TaxID=13489 RepID=A0A8C4GFL9_DICLA|nr:GTPase IMAP family member 9-like isoform X1 [Dicentrarchus labrax]